MRLRNLLILIVVVCLGAGFFAYKAGLISFRRFPKLEEAKQITLQCSYKGKNLVIQEKLYKSVDNFYASDPKKAIYTATGDYKGFVSSYQEDHTLSDIVDKVSAKGKTLGLSKDQTLDLATCFVQNIPYDKEKAKVVLSGGSLSLGSGKTTWGRFPYETLYENKGICTDKSYLEAAIIEKMGYGVAILTFDKERHMAVGVKTPKVYSDYDGKYSYLETTNKGYVVGIVPAIDKSTGGAKKVGIEKAKGGKNNFWVPEVPEPNITPSKISVVTDGVTYTRVVDTVKRIKRIRELAKLINSKSQELIFYQTSLKKGSQDVDSLVSRYESYAANELKQAERTYKRNPTPANRVAYEGVYAQYQSLYSNAKVAIDSYNYSLGVYNAMVSDFNALVSEYNVLNKNIW